MTSVVVDGGEKNRIGLARPMTCNAYKYFIFRDERTFKFILIYRK